LAREFQGGWVGAWFCLLGLLYIYGERSRWAYVGRIVALSRAFVLRLDRANTPVLVFLLSGQPALHERNIMSSPDVVNVSLTPEEARNLKWVLTAVAMGLEPCLLNGSDSDRHENARKFAEDFLNAHR